MFHFLVLLSLLASNIYNVAAVTLDSNLLTQLGYNNQSSSVTVYGQQITDIDSNAFRGYSSLKYLNLGFNEFANLDLVVFKDLINLEILDLGANHPLTQLTNTNKIKFPLMKTLNLYNSLLVSLDSDVINGFLNIKECYIFNDYQLSPVYPNQLSPWKKLRYLSITTNNQISLTKEHFNGLNSLERLSFSGSNIQTVEVHTFLPLTNLTYVELSNNGLTSFEYLQIPPKLSDLYLTNNKMNYFMLSRTMGFIRSLSIAENRFRSFKSMDFSFLANLTYLDLSNNPHAYPHEIPSHLEFLIYVKTIRLINLNISNIDSNFFKKNTNLGTIELSGNKISVLPYNTFSHLKGLTWLDLSYNQISVLDNRTFVGLNQIGFLNLNNNKLNKIRPRTFYNMNLLYRFHLSNNLISEIDSTAFTGCSVLKYLILDHNQLTKLSPRTFEDLNLDALDLSFNQITELDGLTFNGLTVGSLNINNNNISNIVSGTFNNVTITQSLDLSYNQLTNLGNDTFYGLSQLISIKLSGNKISMIEAGAFNGMANVQSITLDGNNLSQLDSSTFAGLSNLQLISLYNNPNLQTSNLQSLCPTTAVNCIVHF